MQRRFLTYLMAQERADVVERDRKSFLYTLIAHNPQSATRLLAISEQQQRTEDELLDDHEVDALAEEGFQPDELEEMLAALKQDGFSVS